MTITVLNYSEGLVHQFNYNGDDAENFLLEEGFRLKDIEWMTHEDSNIY